MLDNLKKTKVKKRKLKPFVKVVLISFVVLILFFVLYKLFFYFNINNFSNNKKTIIKENVLSNKEVDINNKDDDFVSVFKRRLASQNMFFASSTETSNGDIKIFLKNTKDESGYLYVNPKDNVEEVWTVFSSILISEELKKMLKDNFFNLDYIDLRFKNKVFYKFNINNNLSNNSSSTVKNIPINH